MAYLLPQAELRAKSLPGMMALLFDEAMSFGKCFIATDGQACTLWQEPDAPKQSFSTRAANGLSWFGLPWRTPGAINDIAIIGAGCYLDPKAGSAGPSGSAEANTKIARAHRIVENMRRGLSPEDAGMDTLRHLASRSHFDLSRSYSIYCVMTPPMAVFLFGMAIAPVTSGRSRSMAA